MEAKPSHLSEEFAARFEDERVAAAYATRPPYPTEVFATLERLLPDGRGGYSPGRASGAR